MTSFFEKLKQNQELTFDEAYILQSQILTGKMTSDEIIQVLKSFDKRSMTNNEFSGIYKASKEQTVKIKVDFPTLDIVGTGGDGLNTFNISTVSALVCSSLDLKVAKHGNRAASSKCGSGDVLEKLGVKIDLTRMDAEKMLEKTGFVFCFARNFNPAFRYAAEARKIFGKKSYFNFLGPLLNPTSPKFLLVGLSELKMVNLISETLLKDDVQKAWLVKSSEGMDELSLSSINEVIEITGSSRQTSLEEIKENFVQNSADQNQSNFKLDCTEFGLKKTEIKDMAGGDTAENAEIFKNILQNKATEAQKNAVAFNSGAALYISGKANSVKEGVEMALETIHTKKAWKKFEEVLNYSQSLK